MVGFVHGASTKILLIGQKDCNQSDYILKWWTKEFRENSKGFLRWRDIWKVDNEYIWKTFNPDLIQDMA